MSNYVPQHYAAATLFKIGVGLHEIGQTLRLAAKRLDALIEARRKSLDDRRVLNEMSERELRDIGVSGAEVHVLRGGWPLQGDERVRAIEWRHPM
jgi:uncharacterized protein YjiS (DUF1127 family)